MCDVHLVETSRTTCPAPAGLRCSYCGEPLRGPCVLVEGHLDDGSPGLYRFAYHEDCAWDVEHDDEAIDANEGCFDYGTPLALDVPAEGSRATGVTVPSMGSSPVHSGAASAP